MQAAKKLMGKYRVVTLDGEIFENQAQLQAVRKGKTPLHLAKRMIRNWKTINQGWMNSKKHTEPAKTKG